MGPWRVVDNGIGQASTSKLGSKIEVVGVALTPNSHPPPPNPAGLDGLEVRDSAENAVGVGGTPYEGRLTPGRIGGQELTSKNISKPSGQCWIVGRHQDGTMKSPCPRGCESK